MRTSRTRRHLLGTIVLTLVIAGYAWPGGAQQVTPALRSEMAPSGRLRIGINFGNAVLAARDTNGRPSGVAVYLAQELARRVGVPMDIVPFESAGRMTDSAAIRTWDVAFLGADPDRAAEIAFTAPYLEIDTTYLVQEASPLRTIQDVDRDGVRVAVSAKGAYDLFLTRELKRAQLVRAPSPPESNDLFFKERLDALAGLRPVLVDLAAQHPGYRVMDGRFTVVYQAVGTPKGRPAVARFLQEFVEDIKASGLVSKAMDANGIKGVSVAAQSR